VIDVLANDSTSQSCTATLSIPDDDAHKPRHGNATVDENNKIKYTYTDNKSGPDTITYQIQCGAETSEAKVYITATTNAFADNIWYFGSDAITQGGTIERASAGIRFEKDADGNYKPQAITETTKLYSQYGSLVVSSPYCNGQVIFYASNDTLYNGSHEVIGAFNTGTPLYSGLTSHIGIGNNKLAACYMGNNKYMLFSSSLIRASNQPITTPFFGSLVAFVVDMNENSGKGGISEPIYIEMSTSFIYGYYPQSVPPSENYIIYGGIYESIALIAQTGTNDKYWLVYPFCSGSCAAQNPPEYGTGDVLRVRPVDVNNPNSIGYSMGYPSVDYLDFNKTSINATGITLKISPQNNRLAVIHNTDGALDLFDFNPATGVLTNWYPFKIPQYGDNSIGLEFSPDGKQLYVCNFMDSLHQFDISKTKPELVDKVYYSPNPTENADDTPAGGGLKLGPDGRIYVMRHNSTVGVISNPNSKTPLAGRYNNSGLDTEITYYGYQFSTGLTLPSVIDCNTNTAPVVQSDGVELCLNAVSRTAKVNVLKNDSDPDANNVVYLTGAGFVNADDAALAGLTVNAADSTVSLTVKPDAHISVAGKVFEIDYHVKDNGIPASQCATGRLNTKVYPTPNYSDIRLSVCPDAGDINLAKYIDTADMVQTLDWTYKISGISNGNIFPTSVLALSRIQSLTYTVSSRCVISQTRKVYVEILKNGVSRPPKDTVTICHLYAEAVNINQLFGLEAGGTWTYNAVGGGNIDKYVTESPSSSVYAGAVVMNGKAIYKDEDIPTQNYHGVTNARMVRFTYTAANSGCLKDKSYSMVIVLTEDIMK
jgi:hypothetical protein